MRFFLGSAGFISNGPGSVADNLLAQFPLGSYGVTYGNNNEVAEANDCATAASDANGTIIGNGTVLVGSSGDPFTNGDSGITNFASILVGAGDAYDADKVFSILSTGVGLTVKNYDADSQSSAAMALNIGKVVLGDNLTFNGNTSSLTGSCNAFVASGCGLVRFPLLVTFEDYSTTRICGNSLRMTEEAHLYDIICDNSNGSAGVFAGKPWGTKRVYHTGTIHLYGEIGDDIEITQITVVTLPPISTCSVTTSSPHGLAVGDLAMVRGTGDQYLNAKQIVTAITSPTVWEFEIDGNIPAPFSGSALLNKVIKNGSGTLTVDADVVTSDSQLTPTGAEYAAGEITITFGAAHPFSVGDYFVFGNANESGYNGMFQITATTEFTITCDARQTPTATPATTSTSFYVRPAFGPVTDVIVDKVIGRDLYDDDGIYTLQVGDGVEQLHANYIEADNYNFVNANTAIAAFNLNQGSLNWPVKTETLGIVKGRQLFKGGIVTLGLGDVEAIYVNRIIGEEMGVGLDIAEYAVAGVPIPNHGIIKSVDATIAMDGVWGGNSQGRVMRFGTPGTPSIVGTDPTNPIIDTLKLSVPYYKNCQSSLISGIGAAKVQLDLADVNGGFAVANSNPFSSTNTNNFVSLVGTIGIGGARILIININGKLDLGGRGLSSGKTGYAIVTQAWDYIIIRGGIIDGGTGTNQVGSGLLHFKLPTTATDHDTLCRIILEDLTLINGPVGISTDNPSGLAGGDGYELYMSNVTIDSASVTTPVANPSRFVNIRSFDTKGWLNDQIAAVSALPAATLMGRSCRTWVNDANAPTFGSTVAGGGAVSVPVVSDGTNWVVG
jgi:hypothetical protein